jgi:hypothetical protein
LLVRIYQEGYGEGDSTSYNCHALRYIRTLQVDDTIKDFTDKPKKNNDRYRRMQSAVNASVAPVLNLWRDLDEQGISGSQGGLVPVDTVLDVHVLQSIAVLMGNDSIITSPSVGVTMSLPSWNLGTRVLQLS